MQRSYDVHVAEDASALVDIAPFGFDSDEFVETTDFVVDTPEAWLEEEHFMDIIVTCDGEAWLEEGILYAGDIPEAWQLEEHLIDITDDEGDIPEAWLEEGITYAGDIPEAWQLEVHLIDITDDEGDFPEAWQLGEHLIDITNEEGDIPEAWQIEDDGENSEANVIEHLIYGTNREIFPLLDASFHNQGALLSPTQQPFEDSSARKVSISEWIFLIVNILIELLSAAFDQLSSVNKPRYALIAMLMSFSAAIACIIDLAYKAGKERVIWRWKSKLPWFYHSSPSHRRFGTFPEMIGLVSAILQALLSAIAYTFYLQHASYPLKVSFWPVLFAMGLFCSKFM